ncbi:hypothetical protein [Actinoplanes utahensis]|uniref:hypothetical protein n=1 Tax=Actinoplanes utahensis TaxID=1869 RepID=UPI000A4C2C3C|nr:hypothetical protein [Actinoplanes utahensis]
MAERPGDWSALKMSGDPTPGDPDVLLAVADYMDAMARNAETADTGLGQVVAKSGEGAFVGKTADWLREQVSTEMRGFVAGVKQAFSAAGPAIRSYVSALREAQARADRARNEAAGAAGDEARLATLKADAEAAGADLKRAASTAQQAIRDAAGFITSPKTPKSACDIFWEVFGWITLVITIVAIFIGGPLGLIAFGMNAALAVKAMVDFASGKTNALGLVLGLLGLLGPSTRPLIALGDLVKLTSTAWRNLKAFTGAGVQTLGKGIGDFWRMVSTFSLTTVLRGVGDIAVTLGNTVKVGALAIPKVVSSLDGLAVRGFVTLTNFTLKTVPNAVVRGATALPGFAAGLGRSLKNGAITTGNFLKQEFGGWKWLRIFLPLAGHEIGRFGVAGAFKLGVLGRGLAMKPYAGLAALSGGVRLAEGITTVSIVKPGGTPPGGGIHFSPGGLHLPDLTENSFGGVRAPGGNGVSAVGPDFAGLRGPLATPDLAGLKGPVGLGSRGPLVTPELPGMPRLPGLRPGGGAAFDMPGAVDLGLINKIDTSTLRALDTSVAQVKPHVPGGIGAVTPPSLRIGDLGAGLNRFTGGVDGLAGFASPEIRALNTGDISAVRISDTGVSFNLGAAEKGIIPANLPGGATPTVQVGLAGRADLGGLRAVQHGATPHLPSGTTFGRLDVTSPEISLNRAMGLLADTPPAGRLDAGVPSPAGLPHQPPRPDQAGAQLTHLQALDQLKRAHDTLANASGDALSIARAQKDVRVAESLVRRTADGIRIEQPAMPGPAAVARVDVTPPKPAEPVGEELRLLQDRLVTLRGTDEPSPDLAGLELQLRLERLRSAPEPGPAPGLADLPPVPTHAIDDGVGALEARLAALRGTDEPSPEMIGLDLEHRLHLLRGGDGPTELDPAAFPDVPALSPAEGIARVTAIQRLERLENDLGLARAEQPPAIGGPGRAGEPVRADDAVLQARLDALGRTDGVLNLPDVPRTPPVVPSGGAELTVRLDQLVADARRVDLPRHEWRSISTDVRTAVEQGRHGDAARHLTTLHDRIDRHIVHQRLDDFRTHIDAGHHRAAQLGMDKVTWLEHAVGIERAAAAGRTGELHALLDAYENALSESLTLQRLGDLPDPPSGGAADEGVDRAGAAGDDPGDVRARLDALPDGPARGPGTDSPDLRARLDDLRGGAAPDPELETLELQARLQNLRGGGDFAPGDLPNLPDVPTHSPADDALAKRLAALRDGVPGMSAAEHARWNAEFAHAADEAADLDVLTRYHDRVGTLRRDAGLAEIRDGSGPLPAAEQRAWQDLLARVGDDPTGLDVVHTGYSARIAEFRAETGARIDAALSAPDHTRSLGSRVDEALSGLSPELRARNAAEHTTLSDRLAALRGGDEPTVVDPGPAAPRGGDGPAGPRGTGGDVGALVFPDVPATVVKAPEPPAAAKGDAASPQPPAAPKGDAGSPQPPAAPKSDAGSPQPPAAPKGDAASPEPPRTRPGDEVAQLTAPQRPPVAETTTMPPRDLLGGGRAPEPRVVEVDAERWTPLDDAFRFERAGEADPPKVTRPPAGGERVAVRYQLTAGDQEMLFTLRVHLGGDAAGFADVRAGTLTGVDRFLNAPGYRLPGTDVPIRVSVEFVDDPARAHAHVTVAGPGSATNQATWAAGRPPAAYAHEVVHYLGVKDVQPPPGALLHGPAQPGHVHGDLMGGHDGDGEYVLTPGALAQIADVLAPHFSGSPVPDPVTLVEPGHRAGDFWATGIDIPPKVTETIAPPERIPLQMIDPPEQMPLTSVNPPELVPANSLPGLYHDHPHYLYEVDTIAGVDVLIRQLDESVNAVVRARMDGSWRGDVPILAERAVRAPEIGQALRDDPQSFFTTGGRSFDVRDGAYGWHRVTVEPVADVAAARVVDQSADRAKFDTRADQAGGSKQVVTSGGNGSLGAGVMFPQRLGYGAGGSAEVALARPQESVETTVRLTDSHNVRSGSGSQLVEAPVRFQVTATDVRGPVTGPATTAPPVTAAVAFRSVDDLATATPRTATRIDVAAERTAMLVEHFTPVRILTAGLDLHDGDTPTTGWNRVAEEILTRLAPTKAVVPGTIGAGEARGLFAESSILANLMPALDGPVHPPLITSKHGSHALSLELRAVLPDLLVRADIGRSSFRWQPGLTTGTKTTQISRVGGAISVVPIRWGFAAAFTQFRLFGGFFRSTAATAGQSGMTRAGTEFKDVANVAVEAHFRLTVTSALRETYGSRMPFTDGAVPPMTVDLVVLGRLPQEKITELITGQRTFLPSPLTWHVPPYALTGGRSVTYGLTGFAELHADVTALVRRFEGGFLPKFGSPEATRMGDAQAPNERQVNQSELDRVLSPAGLRQGMPALLTSGLVADLVRTSAFQTRHLVVHVTGRYAGDFTHAGVEKGTGVRHSRVDGTQQKIVAGGQWRAGAAVEGGGVFRLVGKVATALVPSGALELRGRFGRQSGAQLTGQQVRLNGGSPDSQAFGNQLEIRVSVYAYTERLGRDPGSRVKVGRVIRQRFPRPADGQPAPETKQVAHIGDATITRYRLTRQRPVTVLFDNASVTAAPIERPPVLTPRDTGGDPMNVRRATRFDLGTLRDWVDGAPRSDVSDWLSVEAMPGSPFVLKLARDVVEATQLYADRASRTRLGGLRGTGALLEGMPLWAGLLRRFTESEQAGALRTMIEGRWHVDKVAAENDGAAVDLVVSAALTNPEIMPAHGLITTESATAGGVEVDTARTREWQTALRGNVSANLRKPGDSKSTSGGGGLINAGYERLLYSRENRDSGSLSGAIERNLNNRKGRTRSYLVKFDMRVSVGAEVTTDPARYAIIPQAVRTGDWLHHHKSVRRDGVITNAVYLRLPADAVAKLGLLPRLGGDTAGIGAPWTPGPAAELRLLPGHGPGLGLYAFRDTPALTGTMIEAMTAALTRLNPAQRATLEKVLGSLTGAGLDDPMLNRRRLLHLLTPAGIAQHWPAMVDGGASVLHVTPGRMTQHARDVRLVATVTGPPRLEGFVAGHDDLDIKTTHVRDAGATVQRAHGGTMMAGAAGTGVSNHHGENLAAGLGDMIGRSSQVTNAQGSGQASVDTQISSGRGVKARLRFPVTFSLVVFDQGKRVDSELLTVHDHVVQDRWADDLRPPRTRPGTAPATYRIAAPAESGPGWRTLDGLPLPPRFSAEDLTPITTLRGTVGRLLGDAAKRLATPGYAGAHQIHQSLTPELLLPAVPRMLTPDGLELPAVTSAQIFGQQAKVTIRLVPEAASLSGVSSGVFREHAPQQTSGYSTGTNTMVQTLRAPRIPLLGRGYADDPYQALEAGGPGIAAGDLQAATDSGNTATGELGNVKPESRSGLIDYLSRVEVTVSLPRTAGFTRTVSADSPVVTVSLRMGLHDVRTALDIDRQDDGLRASFEAIVTNEADLAAAADAFVKAADDLDGARYDAHAQPAGSEARAAIEARIPGLLEAWQQAGGRWWALEQRHHDLLDRFRHEHLGVAASVADPGSLARHLRDLGTVEEVRPEGVPSPPSPAESLADVEVGPEGVPSPPSPAGSLADVEVGPEGVPLPPSPAGSVWDVEVGPEGVPLPPSPAESLADVEVGPEGVPSPPSITRLDVPGDGYCQLYAVIATDPLLVRDRLAAAGLGSPALHAWLGDPAAVRAQATLWTTRTVRDQRGLVPRSTELGQAADLLRTLVAAHLDGLGPDGVPARVLAPLRDSMVGRVRQDADGLDRQGLLDRLHADGVRTVRYGQVLPVSLLRDRYLDVRTRELAGGGDPAVARAHAASEVPLRPGSDAQNLADDALGMQDMLDYLAVRGESPDLGGLSDETLRDLFVEHYRDPSRPLREVEFEALRTAVGRWERYWGDERGETFLPLLASTLGVRFQIEQGDFAITGFGPEDAPLLTVHRSGNHYQATVPAPPAAVPDPVIRARYVALLTERYVAAGMDPVVAAVLAEGTKAGPGTMTAELGGLSTPAP